ncbi:NMN adenylyl transferase and transcriptional regulator [Vibrio phage TCU_VP02_YC]|uniref:NMN adenylyl transferase and transcriptional regulator n=1 Tax=Vibrio phage phi-pp2 TaxID=1204514 RepID=I6XCA7_9CAUD|nr:NMN adenylyl transferase and transcriptional regulator [Vibrio phage phi-pp2]
MHAGVIGKFNNYHQGHFKLIKFALSLADKVTVLLCTEDSDPIPVETRMKWMHQDFGNRIRISVICPSDENLSNKSESDREVSKQWAAFIDERYPEIDAFVGSEQYINYCAEYGNFDGIIYDEAREITPCSSTSVRENDSHEFYSPSAQQDRVRRIAFIGPESCGKSWNAASIAAANGYELVLEAARDIMSDNHYTEHDVLEFAIAQTARIEATGKESDTVIVDSSAITSAVYSQFQFNQSSVLLNALAAFENIDAYVLFRPNCEFVQDGTRTQTQEDRERWFELAKSMLLRLNKPFLIVQKGNDWEERLHETASHVSLLRDKVKWV